MAIVIPPNGFVGSQFQSAAVQLLNRQIGAGRTSATRRKKRKKAKAAKKTRGKAAKPRKQTRSKSRAKLVKGSAAAKAWGRKMKALRKKRG